MPSTERVFFFLVFSRVAPAAYEGSQARGPIGAAAAGLHTATATRDPSPTEQGQGSNPQLYGS